MAPNSPPLYRRLASLRKSFVHRAQVWQGEDHLLVVSSIFAIERYRRFYFKDIEALIIRSTNRRRTWVIVSSALLAVFGVLALVCYFGSTGGRSQSPFTALPGLVMLAINFLTLAVFGLVLLIWHLALGPTCLTFLQVRGGLERLGAPDRLRQALKLRERLAALMAEQAPARPTAVGDPLPVLSAPPVPAEILTP